MKPPRTDSSLFLNLPPELKTGKQFVCFRFELRDDKWTKVPIDPLNGRNARLNDPATWGTFDDALTRFNSDPELAGVGRVFTAEDPITGIDLDHCTDKDGILSAEAVDHLRRFDSYAERSPGGEGLHIFVKARHALDGKGKRKKGDAEIFSYNCFFTLTGKREWGGPSGVEPRQEALDTFYWDVFGTNGQGETQTKPTVPTASDQEVLKRIKRSSNGEKIRRLLDGEFDHASQSEADLALCSHLWFHSGNRSQVERMMGHSKLGERGKWQDRPDYRQRTLAKACEGPVWCGKADISATAEMSLIDAADLYSAQITPTKWIVEGIIAEGLTILAGKPKAKKSWLALDVALKVVTGGAVLGKFPVEAGEVLYLALEDNRSRLQKRVRKLCGSAVPSRGLHFITATEGFPKLDNGGVDKMEALLAQHPDITLIIVDTFQKVRPRGSAKRNAYENDYEALGELHKMALRHRVAVLLIHHLRKSTNKDDIYDDISGSLGLTGTADTNIILQTKRMDAAVLHINGRAIEEQMELALSWNGATARWSIAEEGVTIMLSETRRAIIEAIGNGEDKTIKEIGSAITATGHAITEGNLQRTVRRMVADQQLLREGLTYKVAEKYCPTCPSSPVCPSSPICPTAKVGQIGQVGSGGCPSPEALKLRGGSQGRTDRTDDIHLFKAAAPEAVGTVTLCPHAEPCDCWLNP